MNWKYTNIMHNPRKQLGISVLEYCVLDYIYKTQTNPKYTKAGATNVGCHKIADFMGISSATVKGIFDRMADMGYLEKFGKDMKQVTAAFYEVAYEAIDEPVQKVNARCSETEREGVRKLNGNRSETEHINKGNEIINKIEYKEEIKIIDQVDETKVILHDTIKPDRKPKAELPKIVVDVVDYLNQKTNQSFKPTTKETIQNINRQVNLDKWEFEDFKAVIDFKTKDWLHDDKMRQYLNPSTLFRQANAEKYLLAAKASKPKPAVQQRLTPLPKEQKPALTNHDIEASNAHLAEVGNVFAKMGVRL